MRSLRVGKDEIKGERMINELPKTETPEWLQKLVKNPDAFKASIPLEDLLMNSLYYPACGLNGTPVKYLGGNIVSFLYADYALTLPKYKRNLFGSGEDDGFKGFRCLVEREVQRSEIVPANWRPSLQPTSEGDIRRLVEQERRCRPFGHWSIWQKDDPKADGAELFSFFYLGGEMNAIYQGLYCRLAIRPKILAIIQPGAIGGEWEGVTSDESFFKKVVSSNSAGFPDYLLHGGYGSSGFYSQACWKEYHGERLVQLAERSAGLWKLNTNSNQL